MLHPNATFKCKGASRPVALAMARYGRHIAVARKNGRVELWDVGGNALGSHVFHDQPASTVCVSDDGLLVASVGKRLKGNNARDELIIWNVEMSTCNRVVPRSSAHRLRAPFFLPGGHQLVVSSDRPRLYNGLSGKQVRLGLPKDRAWQAADVSYWGEVLGLGTSDGGVFLVKSDAPTQGQWLCSHQSVVEHVAFCNQGETLATLSRDGSLRF